jgi:hypothetical protein
MTLPTNLLHLRSCIGFRTITLICLATILIYTTEIVSAQEQTEKWQIGATITPGYSYRILAKKDELRDEAEMARFVLGGGLSFQYKLNSKFYLTSGISYSNYAYSLNVQKAWDYLNLFDQIDPTFGWVYNTTENRPEKEVFADYTFRYAELPVGLQFSTGNDKTKFVLAIEGVLSILIDKKFVYNGTSSNRGDFNIFNSFLSAKAGMQQRLSSRIDLQLLPCYSYGLLKIRKGSNPPRLTSYGLDVTLLYKLMK